MPDNPPWNADHHLNVNLQMNYASLHEQPCAETAKPMINYIDDMRYYGRIKAKEYAGRIQRYWSTPRQHHLAGLLQAGIVIAGSPAANVLDDAECSMTIITYQGWYQPKKRFILC